MTLKTRRLLIRCLVILMAVALLAALGLWHVSRNLVSPPRRALQTYHHEWLDQPAAHGISIRSFLALQGSVPCLLVSPDPKSTISDRGRVIRTQLTELGSEMKPFGTEVGTLLMFHGRNGRKEDLLPAAERFCAIGIRCILPDLPAHGDSRIPSVGYGTAEQERDLGGKLLNEVSQAAGFDPHPAALWGMSMGGAFATRTASQAGEAWAALVVVSSFDALDGVIQDQCASMISAGGPFLSWSVQMAASEFCGLDVSRARPAEWARSANLPVMVVHGTADPLISLERGRRLFESFPSSSRRWVEVAGATHENVLVTGMPLYATMGAWLLQRMPTASPCH